MVFIVGALVLIAIYLPQLWAQVVLKKHARPREDLSGTGGELAQHLLKTANIKDVGVEALTQDGGDHYDPMQQKIRLGPANYSGRSLTAVVVAAHEFGHAVQDHIGYGPLYWRTRLAGFAAFAERIASLMLIAMPIIAVLTRVPVTGVFVFALAVIVMLVPVMVHLVTLPVEFDASFNRALPVLEMGYLEPEDIASARKILWACALTYLAGSLASLLNFWRWIRFLRR
ncbi:MAG: zinc metallopeptidase [Pseudomonadota bacterium]